VEDETFGPPVEFPEGERARVLAGGGQHRECRRSPAAARPRAGRGGRARQRLVPARRCRLHRLRDAPRRRLRVPGALPLDGERLEAAVSVGGGIGYQLANWLRVDATVDHRFGAELSGTRPNPTYAVGSIRDVAEIESTTGLLNAYVDLGSWAGVTPYLGAGIGVAGNRLTNARREAYLLGEPVGAAVIDTRTTYNLAWALMAGLAVDLGSGFKVDLGYRYTHLGDVRTRVDAPGAGLKVEDLNAHEVRLGARYMIE
jgi:opacity protein-like surface antigen